MKRRGVFVCFTGIDGSGKTSLSKTMVSTIKKTDVQTRYVRGGFDEFKALAVFILVFKRVLFIVGKKADDFSEGVKTERKLLKNRFFAELYSFLVLLDYLLQIFVYIKLPLSRGISVFCDRYIYDTAVYLSMELDFPEFKIQNLLRRLCRFVPKPDLVFLLDLSDEVAYERNKIKNDKVSLAYLSQARKIYLNLSKNFGFKVLDSSLDLSQLRCKVKEEVDSLMRRGGIN